MTAVGLSMDAFAVSITEGLSVRKRLLYSALLFAVFFGGFQGLMPILGWFAGNLLHAFPLGKWDHWIAFSLLASIGVKMIIESFDQDKKSIPLDHGHSLHVLVGLSIATSIDALAVGLSLSFLNVNIFQPALIIAGITFIFSFIGIYIGRFLGGIIADQAERIGGLVLIMIGAKILIEHLL
jgi:putative Mn2+ efflux pump MntP